MLSPYATSVRSVLISLFLLFPRPRCTVPPSASTNSWPRRRCRRRFLPYVHAANARIAYATYAILSAPHRTRMPLFSPSPHHALPADFLTLNSTALYLFSALCLPPFHHPPAQEPTVSRVASLRCPLPYLSLFRHVSPSHLLVPSVSRHCPVPPPSPRNCAGVRFARPLGGRCASLSLPLTSSLTATEPFMRPHCKRQHEATIRKRGTAHE